MVKPVTEKQRGAFNKVAGHPLQTWEWGEFRKATGNEVVRLGVFSGNKFTDAIQIMIHKIPGTKYKIATLIKGPKPTREIIEKLKDLAKEENLIFIKLEPNTAIKIQDLRSVNYKKESNHQSLITNHSKEKLIKLLRENGCVSGRTLFTPTSFWIDLTPPEEGLLKSFHSKTRYNIRLAQKKGVKVIEDNSKKAFERYIELTRETVERQGFYAHTEKYHRLMWKHLHKTPKLQNSKTPIARLLTARYKNQIITTWILFVWKDTLYYPYGASSDKYKNVMASNLIMWEAIKYGKKLGLKTFDLWGREPGKGFTRFKEGYNPKVVEFLGTWDLVTNPLYYPYREVETIRWLLLRTRSKLAFTKSKF